MKETGIIEVNNALLNVISPIVLKFERNYCLLGENKARTYAVVKYPPNPAMGWLAQITDIPDTIVSLTFEPIESAELMANVSRNVAMNRGNAESTKDTLTRQRAIRGAESGEQLLKNVDQYGEAVGYLSMLFMPYARHDADFDQAAKRAESAYSAKHLKVRGLSFQQEDGLRSLLPYGDIEPRIQNIARHIMPLSTVLGGLPFSSYGHNDGSGYYFAKDANRGLIILDPWKRGGDRTNSNMVIMGKAGAGKSTAVKNILISEFIRDTTILALDPERELRELTANLDGAWINAAGSDAGRINPLQIRPGPKDDDSGNAKGLGPLALHMKTLEVFLALYLPSLTDMQKVLLKETLEQLYFSFDISWDTDVSDIPNEKYPIFKDLYDLLLKKYAEMEQTRRDSDPNHYQDLAYLFRDIAIGSDSYIFNGYTTLTADKKWICLDTFDLQGTPDNIKKACYFNVLSWCWERMSRDRTERVLFSADEAYLLIDPNVPQTLVFLRNIMKRCRKYEASVAIISHSVVDFLDPSIRMYGQALLDIPNIKLIMGTDGRNLQDTAELFNLTEAEQAVLYSQAQGQGLLMIGSRKFNVMFEIPQYRLDMMGSGGGR